MITNWGMYCCVILLCCMPVSVLTAPVVYRLGANEKMPSNHVYHMLVDKNGYLWMATSHGVVRYNGYETKTFDLYAGLPSNDIWGLHEDKSGRIWVLCFCHVLGYIYGDEYYPVALQDPPPRLYPKVWNIGGRIMLYTLLDGTEAGLFYLETGGEMPGFPLRDVVWAYYDAVGRQLFYVTRDSKTPNGQIRLYKIHMAPGQIVRQEYASPIVLSDDQTVSMMFDKYYMYAPVGDVAQVRVLNILTGQLEEIVLDSEVNDRIKIFNRNRDLLWMYSGSRLYQFNDQLAQTKVVEVPSAIRSLPVSSVLYDDLWGGAFGTAGEGVYIEGAMEHEIVAPPFVLPHGYRYVGKAASNTSFWWSQWNKRLMSMDSAGRVMPISFPSDLTVIKILPWSASSSLVVGIHSLYLLDHATGWFRPFMQGKHLDPRNEPAIDESLAEMMMRNLDLVMGEPNEFFLLTRSGIFHFQEDQDTIRVRSVESASTAYRKESYVNIAYDPFRKALWANNNNNVLKYSSNGQVQVYKNESQVAPAIRNVEQILVDKRFGTLFLKEFDRIRVHDVFEQRFRSIHPGINLRKTVACIEDDLLVVAGKFGVAISKIVGYGQLSEPLIYPQMKNLQYSDVYDVQVIGADVIITTDKGRLSVPLSDSIVPGNYKLSLPLSLPYRVLVAYSGDVSTVYSGDTIQIDQENLKLQFDVIRPSGTGELRYMYSFPDVDQKWQSLAGRELLLPPLKSGSVNRLVLRFWDDVWQSSPVIINLYTKPYWWQTPLARAVMSGGTLLGFILLIVASVAITKRIVVNNNRRRNAHMEIELKALYAQINPHFIFNTLNTALFFIESRKIEEAHTHVSRFSNLLRSYIKSSRNRFITIAEEVENLHHYIGLQQMRFWEKFNYQIIVDDGVEANRVRIPALLFQPLVENAIHHGLFHKKEKGLLTIHFMKGQDPQEIICIIEDDGIGRKQSREIRKNSTLKKNESYGDRLIEDLIRIFNKYEGTDIRIAYLDKESPNTGTVVTLYFKKAL